MVREHVALVPRDLLREEPFETRTTHELRQRRRVAEAVGQPHTLGADAELLLEEALPVRELTRERLTGRHDRVRLDPHAAEGEEAPLLNGVLHTCEHLGTVLFDPLVLLSTRHSIQKVRVTLDELGHRGRRASDLADRLTHRPEPRGVDVRVADGRDAVAARLGGRVEHIAQLGAGLGCRLHDVLQVEPIESVVERLKDAEATGCGLGKLRLQLEQHLEVERELEDLGLEDRELHAARAVQLARRRGEDVALLGRQEGVVVEQHRVGRGLEVQVDDLAALRRVGDRHPLVARVDALHRGAVGAVHESLTLEARHVLVETEVHAYLDGASGPRLGNLACEVEPGRSPGRAPLTSDLEGLVIEGDALRGSDRLTRQLVCLHGESVRRRVDCRNDAFSQHAGHAADGE